MSTVLSQGDLQDLGQFWYGPVNLDNQVFMGDLGIPIGARGGGGGGRAPAGPPPAHAGGPHHHHDRRVRIFQDFVYPYYPYYPVYPYYVDESASTEAEIERLRADRDRAIAEKSDALQRCVAAAQAVVTKSNGSAAVQAASQKVIADCHQQYNNAIAAIEARYQIALSELRKRLLYSRNLPYGL